MDSRLDRAVRAAGFVALFSSLTAASPQALNPSYLSEMPAPARVIAEIHGKDAEDTGERQMGAFMALVQIIDDMAWGIGHRYVAVTDNTKATPDEARIRLAYQTAYAELWHKVTNKEGHVYDHDPVLRNEILSNFFSESFRSLYLKSNGNAAADAKAFHDKMYGNPANTTSSRSTTQPAPLTPAPGSSAELRRCIASGRTLRNCMTEGLGGGFGQLIGVNLTPPVPTGLRMTGDYAGPGGLRLIFEPEQATLVCRGVPAPAPYSVQVTDAQATVTIQHQSRSFVFSLRQDGMLAGPSGPIRVTGQVPIGSHAEQTMGTTTRTMTTTRELTPLEAGGYPGSSGNLTRNGQVFTVQEDASQLVYGPTGTQTVTDFATKTADCTLGPLSPFGASPQPHVPKNDFDVLTTIGAGMGTLLKGGNMNDAAKEMLFPDADKPIAPGLRMGGAYASDTGFGLSFHPESVTVACGDAEQALEYSIRRVVNKTMLVIMATPNPISLQLMPEGAITGEGAVQVNGRIVTGTTDDLDHPFVFAPHVARCTIGRLVAGAAQVMPPAAAQVAASAPASAVNAGAAPSGGSSLRIAASPGVASLVAGKALLVLKDSLENALGSAGIVAQAGGSRIAAWTRACERAPREVTCQQGIGGLAPYIVARSAFDGNGVAVFNTVPSSGTFYVVADSTNTNHHLWNLRIDLKPGANSIVLDERNSTPIF